MTYVFREKAIKVLDASGSDTTYGWNHCYRDVPFPGSAWDKLVDQYGNSLYTAVDFSPLFDFVASPCVAALRFLSSGVGVAVPKVLALQAVSPSAHNLFETTMTIDFVERGDPLSAACQNELIGQVNAIACPGTAGQAQYGTAGITFHGPPQTHLAIFELLSSLSFPDLDDIPSGYFDREPTPFAQAKMVFCHQYQTADVAPDGTPIRSYGGTAYSGEVTVWQPGAADQRGLCLPHAGFPGRRPGLLLLEPPERPLGDYQRWTAVVHPLCESAGRAREFHHARLLPLRFQCRSVPIQYCDPKATTNGE